MPERMWVFAGGSFSPPAPRYHCLPSARGPRTLQSSPIIPAAPAPDRWVRGATHGPRALIGGVADRRRGDDGGDHTTGAGRGRPAAGGGPVPGRAGGAADARLGAGAGGGLAGGGGAGGRHGPADAPGLGAPLQRGGPRRPARPAPPGAEAAAHPRAGGRAGRRRGAGAGPGPGRRGALAPGGPGGADRGPRRRRAARALGRRGAAPARLRPHLGAPETPEVGRGGAGGGQKGFADLAAAALPEHARGRPIEGWFQDEARVGRQGTLTRVWARRGTRP